MNPLDEYTTLLTQIQQAENPEPLLRTLYHTASQLPDKLTESLFGHGDYQFRQRLCWYLDILREQADQIARWHSQQKSPALLRALVLTLDLSLRLQNRFPEQTHQGILLPKTLQSRFANKIKPAQEALHNRLQELRINEALITVALYPYRRFTAGQTPLCYNDMDYLRRYDRSISAMQFQHKREMAVNERLFTNQLLKLNYNPTAMLDYLATQTEQDLDAQLAAGGKKLVFTRQRRWIRQHQMLNRLSFDPSLPGIQEAFGNWLNEEEAHQDTIRALAKSVKPGLARNTQQLDISVTVLALLTRLWYRQGLYGKKKTSEIIEHVVATYGSKNKEYFSRNSFKNAFNSPRAGTAIALRKIIRALLDDLEYFIKMGDLKPQADLAGS